MGGMDKPIGESVTSSSPFAPLFARRPLLDFSCHEDLASEEPGSLHPCSLASGASDGYEPSVASNPELNAASQLPGSQCATEGHRSESNFVVGTAVTLDALSNRAFFESSFMKCASFVNAKLPWETDFAMQIFGDEVLHKSVLPSLCSRNFADHQAAPEVEELVEDTLQSVEVPKGSAVFTEVIRCLDDRSFKEQRDSLIDAVICKLLIVLRHCLLASAVGRQIVNLGTVDEQLQGAPGIVAAVAKSPCTVVKRANSLLSFLRWCAKQKPETVNPFSEPMV